MNGYVGAFKKFVYEDGHHKLEYDLSPMATMLVVQCYHMAINERVDEAL